MFGCLWALAMLATAVAAGLGKVSFWWTLLPAFLAGSFNIANSHMYGRVLEANATGDLKLFPRVLGLTVGSYMVVAAVIYWIAGRFS